MIFCIFFLLFLTIMTTAVCPPTPTYPPLKDKTQPKLNQEYQLILYILTSVWVLRTPKAGLNMLFHCILFKKAEKRKKNRKIEAEFSKKLGSFNLHQNAGQRFY